MRKVLKIICIILGIIVVLGIVFFTVDYNRVRNQKKPIFCIQNPAGGIMDGGTIEYFGLGYKVIDFHTIAGFDDIKIGSWFMKYNDFEKEIEEYEKKYETQPAKNFEILFKERKLIDSYNKVYAILDKSETDKYDYTIYAYNGSVNIRIEDKEYSLRDALLENKITMEEIIAKSNKDLEEKHIIGDVYLDGGSKIYIYNDYTIIKCNTLNGNRDVYIGSKDMNINDLEI